MSRQTGFVRWHPEAKRIWLYSRPEAERSAIVRDVRWGDYLNLEADTDPDWFAVHWGGKRYFIPRADVASTRPVEVLFADVGQGDGAIFTSAETGDAERIFIIDAGEHDEMFNLVKWRFGKLKARFNFAGCVITHPDADHYRGFKSLFEHPNVGFDTVYHNGLLERTGDDLLGPTQTVMEGRGANRVQRTYLTEIAETDADVRRVYADEKIRGGKWYPDLLHTAMTSDRFGPIEMLSTKHGTKVGDKRYLPDFAPTDGRDTRIQIVGPVPTMKRGKLWLRVFDDKIGGGSYRTDKTKNGHSVLLRLDIGYFSLLFGGDLNRPAEDYLLRHYGEVDHHAPLSDAVVKARRVLRSDVMKCCHHGASDVTDEFLEAVDAFAYVVSSGDGESHAHPRPDLLGRLGRRGRGNKPHIFCTEILRTTTFKDVRQDLSRVVKLNEEIEDLVHDIATRREQGQDVSDQEGTLEDKRGGRTALLSDLETPHDTQHGAITLRTDGYRLEVSFLLERRRGKQRWQSFRFVHDPQTEVWYPDDAGSH